nr:MAG TPA: hypothetical protein [Caudoviricetes sp.]
MFDDLLSDSNKKTLGVIYAKNTKYIMRGYEYLYSQPLNNL